MTNDRLHRLESFARMETPIDPGALAEAVSAMCIEDESPLTAAEAALAHDILVHIYKAVQADMRRILAERFADRADAPRALVLALANDAIEIARPVIRLSPVLGDEDLVRLVVDGGREHRLAVTERPSLSARVCDVLIYLADPEIVLRIAGHPQAGISPHALQRMVLASRESEALQPLLLRRPEMRDDLAAAMYHWVADDLKQFIAETFGDALARHLGPEIDAAAGVVPQRQTVPAESLPASLGHLVLALRRDDLSAAEREMARLTRLPAFATERLLYNDNGEGLAVVCRSAGADQATFGEIFALLNSDGAPAAFARTAAYRAALAYFHRLSSKQADLLLDGWRANPRTVWGNPARTNAAAARRDLSNA